MGFLFIVCFLFLIVSIIILVFGLIKKRKSLILKSGIAILMFAFLTNLTVPPTTPEQQQSKAEKEVSKKVQQETEKKPKLKINSDKLIKFYTAKGFTVNKGEKDSDNKLVHLKSPNFNDVPVSILLHYIDDKNVDSISCEYDININQDSKNAKVMETVSEVLNQVFDNNAASAWDEITNEINKGMKEKKNLYQTEFQTKGVNSSLNMLMFPPNGIKITLGFIAK